MESSPRLFADEVEPLRGLAPWLGGKRSLARRIVREIMRIPHRAYCEPFVGMGGIFLRRPRRASAEVINDASRDIVNLFRIAQLHPDALIAELSGQLMGRAEFERQARVDPDSLTDIERAARFLFLQYAGFGGKPTSRTFGVDPGSAARFQPRRVAQLLRQVNDRLEGVVIEHLDACQFMLRYDRPWVLYYLDPPYIGSEGDYGAELFTPLDHRRIADHLVGLQASWVLSINDCDLARKLFGRWNVTEVELAYTINPEVAGVRRRELIISNR